MIQNRIFQFIIGLYGAILASWLLCVHLCFTRVNARDNYYLYKLWMRISFEIPAKSERDYKVVGLSRKENKRFWAAEDEFNARFSKVTNVVLFVSCFVFPIQLFFVKYEVDSMFVYVVVHAVNYLYTAVIIYLFLGIVVTLNVFYIEIIMFMNKKIGFIAKQIERMNVTATGPIDNRKLSRLIVDYNRVLFELIQMNNFFKVRRDSY